jgi:hypothetical protein
LCVGKVAKRRYAAAADADIALPPAVMIDDGAALQQEIVGGEHICTFGRVVDASP